MMLHVTTGNCLCVGVKIEHTKGAALLPISPAFSQHTERGKGAQPLPQKSYLHVRESELFLHFYPLLMFLQAEISQKPQPSYSGELFNPCSRKQAFSAMAAPRCVSSASRDLKPFCPFFRAQGEITLASVLRTQLQGSGSQRPQKCKAGSCPTPLIPASSCSWRQSLSLGQQAAPASQESWGEEHLGKETPACAHRIQFDLPSPKQDSPWTEKTQLPADLVLCTSTSLCAGGPSSPTVQFSCLGLDCCGLMLSRCQEPMKASCSLPSAARQRRESLMKGS